MDVMVSVIVAVYNVEKYLRDSLQSLANQTYTRFEAIVVDDGSTDGCPAICDEFAARDARFRVVHKANGGLVSARKCAQQLARGKYFAWLDSDDRLAPDYLKRLVAKAEADTLDITWCDVTMVRSRNTLDYRMNVASDSSEMLHRLLRGTSKGWMWCKLIRRDYYLRSVEHLQEGANVLEDVYQSVQLLAHPARLGYVAQPLYFYNRTNETSYTRQADPFVKGAENIRLIHDYLHRHGLYKEYGRDFCALALHAKIGMLLTGHLDEARAYLPKTHRHLHPYLAYTAYAKPLARRIKALNFWAMLNLGIVGRLWYALYKYTKKNN